MKPQTRNPGASLDASALVCRKHAARSFVGVLALCLVWNFVTRPMEGRLSAQRAAYGATTRALTEFEASDAGAADLEPTIAAMKARRDAIFAWAAKSGEMSRLYESIRKLASQYKVRIERIEPTAARAAGARAEGGAFDPSAELFGYTMELTGTYEAIASFAAACDSQLGATKVTTMRIAAAGPTPAGTTASVSAVLETMHLKLTPKGARDAKDAKDEKGAHR